VRPRAPSTRDWFRDDELEQCPRCGQKAALRVPDAGAVVCTACGVVGFRGADGPPRLVEDAETAKDAA
jgi:ribosomal protein L37AE/L43A